MRSHFEMHAFYNNSIAKDLSYTLSNHLLTVFMKMLIAVSLEQQKCGNDPSIHSLVT